MRYRLRRGTGRLGYALFGPAGVPVGWPTVATDEDVIDPTPQRQATWQEAPQVEPLPSSAQLTILDGPRRA